MKKHHDVAHTETKPEEPTTSRERQFLAFGRVDIICVITLSLIVLHLTGVLPQAANFWRSANAAEVATGK